MVIVGDRHDLPNDNAIAAEELPSKLQTIRLEVQQALRQAYEKSAKRYNLRARPIKYAVGDTVWKKNTVLSNKDQGVMHKMLNRFDKCTVLACVGKQIYTLANKEGKNIGNFHSSMLKADQTN